MRRKVVKPKDRRKVRIPDELRDSMREVYDYIREAKRNGEPPIDYDDAIQIGAVCGGRVGTKLRPFVFTFYPADDKRHGRWYLTLHRTEIEDIGDGRMTEIMMYCCATPDCRMKFRESDETCFFCDYEDDAETQAFQAKLNSIAADVNSKQEWVVAYLALKPNASGMVLIGDYNPIDNLGDRLGWFSIPEAEEMIRQVRSQQK
jgi:hypothetical protein